MANLNTPILVVDDDAFMCRTTRSMLYHIGFREIVENDGKTAFNVLLSGRFGLVLSDLNMDPISGLELLNLVRNEPLIASIPFIMVTGASQENMVRTALKLKVDAYIVKPFNTATLKSKVINVLEKDSA